MSTDTKPGPAVEPFLDRKGSWPTDQMDYSFIEDVYQISQWSDPEDFIRASGWADDAHELSQDPSISVEELIEALAEMATQAEDLLEDMGFYVEWGEGYTIFRDPAGAGPFPNGAPWE